MRERAYRFLVLCRLTLFAAHFRLFIGDLDPAISDDAFRAAFSGDRFPSFVKSKVVRDKYTNKGKGYGFVAYSDPEDFLKAWKEMNGPSRPGRSHLSLARAAGEG